MTPRRPFSVSRLLLRLIVPGGQRDAVMGDLEEERAKRLHSFGPSSTRWWYRREAASLMLAFVRQRLFERERLRAPRKVRPEMRALLNDLKFGFRALIKQPVSAAMSVLILAVGIGLSTSMFTILYGVFLRGLDLPEADRTIMVFETNLAEGDDKLQVPIHDFFEWRENQRSFEGLFAWYQRTMNVSGTGENPQRFRGAYATGNLFDMLRVQPMMGRGFRQGDDDPGAPLVAVIGYDVWNGHFHGAEDVVGKSFKVNGRTATVIGVMPEDFGFPSGQQVWMPMTDRPADVERGERPLTVMGRLRDDVTMDQAQLELASIARGMEEQFPETNDGVGVRFLTFAQNATPLDNFGSVFVVMMAAGLLVLLVACANVANILLAKAAMRTKEAAIRSAMGASRLRVVLPFFAESIGLALLAAAFGTALAFGAVEAFDRATKELRPFFIQFVVDGPVLLYVLGVAAFTSIAAGALPSVKVARADANSMLKDESRGTSSLRMGRVSRMLVVGEVALSCLLLVGAGLMTKSMKRMADVGFAFDPEVLFAAQLVLPGESYETEQQRRDFHRDFLESLSAAPEVRSASLASSFPGLGGTTTTIRLEGEPVDETVKLPVSGRISISPGYFATLGLSPVMGREFDGAEGTDQQAVAVVGKGFAERFFPNTNPVGERFHEGSEKDGQWVAIIGVVPEIGLESLNQTFGDSTSYYTSTLQDDRSGYILTVRPAAGDPLSMAAPVRRTLAGLDDNLPIFNESTLAQPLERMSFFFNIFGTLFVSFGAVTLAMAVVGLYGVLSFSVTSRMQELGVRIALGAAAGDVVRLIIRQGGVQVAVGMIIGLAGALGVTRFLGVFLVDINPRDPIVFSAVALVVAAVGLFAMLVPARRASRVDPMVALRAE